MADFATPEWDYYWLNSFWQPGEDSHYSAINIIPSDGLNNEDTPEAIWNAQSEEIQVPQSKKRSHKSEHSQPNAIIRPRKTRKLKAPHETAKIREIGACFSCQKIKKPCDSGTPCRRCLERSDQVVFIPGLLRPICWRPNMGCIENFRRSPTIDLAASLRGNVENAGPCKQALWNQFAIRRSGKEPTRTVELSQSWTSNTLRIRLDRYQPMDTDRQYQSWFDGDVEQQYQTPAYGIENLAAVSSAIEKFLAKSFDGYIDAHMRNADDITQKTFKTAQDHKHLPLVERALKLWVCCRFIEEPWSIMGSETLGMSKDINPNSPYHSRIPLPRIVDLQIDQIVINDFLQPELKKILKISKKMLQSSDSWNNWFEIYLAYFILLHNVELTMEHDTWFVKQCNLKTKYSNMPLVETITQGANTLLTCFHYAQQGYAPFSKPELEETENWTEEEREYLRDIRCLMQRLRGDHLLDPAKELFWTSQLHKPDWRPVILMF